MTNGEKMVYAAAFAAEYARACPAFATSQGAEAASLAGFRAVTAMRFGAPDSEFRTAMVGPEAEPTERATFNHTRADGPFDPCPECLERLDRGALLALAKAWRTHDDLLRAAGGYVDSVDWERATDEFRALKAAVDRARGDS
jgi:hypothetical protein